MMKASIFTLITAALLMSLPACSPTEAKDDGEDNPWSWDKGKEDETQKGGSLFYPKAEGSFRIMVYNVGAFGKYMENSTDMVAAMIKEVEADVVGINELDSCNARHRYNQAAMLASALGNWQWRFGRTLYPYRDGAYGNGAMIPSDRKIVDSYVIPFPSLGNFEKRALLVVETDKYVLGVSHVDHSSEPPAYAADQYADMQIDEICKWAQREYKDYDKPVFFCGDMNSIPTSEPITRLKSVFELISSAEPSVPVTGPTRCIDYIFMYKGAKQVKVLGSNTMTKFTNGDVTKASDHCPVYVDVKL